jgi:hypothetical protein
MTEQARPPRIRRRWCWAFAIVVGVITEALCLYCRFGLGQTAVEFNRTAPLLLQLHHMFWSVPLLILLPFVWRWERLSGVLAGASVGFIVSDLAHHFVILPITAGETGWHWP